MEPETTVFIVDDDSAMRSSLTRMLQQIKLLVRSFSDAREFLEAYDPAIPSCLVLDVRMPGMSGIELHKKLVAAGSVIPVIIITGHADVPIAVQAMHDGVFDFLQKPFVPQQLLDCIQNALEVDAKRRRAGVEQELLACRFAKLTSRATEVVMLVASGLNNKQVAVKLGVTPQTIDGHRARAMETLGISSIAELAQTVLKYEIAITGTSSKPVCSQRPSTLPD